MTIKDPIVAGLNEMKERGEINEYVHELLLIRADCLQTALNDCENLAQAVKSELYKLDMEPGYTGYGEFMTPISREEALKLYDDGHEVFLIYSQDAEGICDNRSDIENGVYCYALEQSCPQSLVQNM